MSQPRMTAAEFRRHAFESQSEDEFQQWLLRFAELHGWFAHHVRPALRKDGTYYSPIEGNSGFVDVVLAKEGRPVHLWELKSMDGLLRPDQRGWLQAMSGRKWRASDSGIVWPVGKGFSVGVVRPDMRPDIERELD